MSDLITFPYPFTPGFMGFETETEFMLDFHASCRDSGLKRYAKTYRELCETQSRPMAEPKSFVPTVTLANEGGEPLPTGNANSGTYEGPKDLDYEKKFGKLPGTRSGRGYVHAMSEAQKRFVLSLLNKKDTTILARNLVKGWTLDPTKIDSISKQHARPFIDALLSCPDKVTNDSDTKGLNGSPKQIEWITLGLNGKPSLLKEKGFLTETDISALYKRHNYSAKQIIDALLKLPRKTYVNTTSEEITEGAYWFTNEKGERLIARVQRTKNEAKRLYAKLQTEVGGQHFEYEPGLIRKLKATDKLSLSQMQEFAAQYSQCADCGTRMTNPISIARGVGPICSGKGYTL